MRSSRLEMRPWQQSMDSLATSRRPSTKSFSPVRSSCRPGLRARRVSPVPLVRMAPRDRLVSRGPRGPVDLRGLQGATESTVQTESRGRPERTASEALRACRHCLAPMGLQGLAARQVKTGRQAPLVLTAMMVRPRTRWQSLQGSSARKPNGSTPSWEKRALGVLLVLMVPTELKVPEVRVARKASRVCRVKLAQQALTASPDLRVSLVLQVSAVPLVRRASPGRLVPRDQPVRTGPLARKAPRGPRAIQVKARHALIFSESW